MFPTSVEESVDIKKKYIQFLGHCLLVIFIPIQLLSEASQLCQSPLAYEPKLQHYEAQR